MSRTVIALMAGILCALAGCKYAASLKAEAVRLTRWGQLLAQLELLLREGLPIPAALSASAQGRQPPDDLLRQVATDLQASPLTTPETAFRSHDPGHAEQEPLARMFRGLGQGSKDSRCLAVSQCAAEIALMAKSASSRAAQDVKLWQTLGFIGGACLTILLL